jgi:hypothetical protein
MMRFVLVLAIVATGTYYSVLGKILSVKVFSEELQKVLVCPKPEALPQGPGVPVDPNDLGTSYPTTRY